MPGKEDWTRRFYNSTAWKRKRAYILRRDHFLCQEHLRRGKRVTAVLVHHVRALERFPELGMEDGNLESVCAQCHEQIHARRTAPWTGPPAGVRVVKP